jgi:hypothetical protein
MNNSGETQAAPFTGLGKARPVIYGRTGTAGGRDALVIGAAPFTGLGNPGRSFMAGHGLRAVATRSK